MAGTTSGGTGGAAGTAGDDAGTTGGTGGTMSGGTGGTMAGGTGGMTGGTGGTAGMEPSGMMCGDKLCTVNMWADMFGIVACCTEDNECGGFGGKCHALDQEGSPDEACPDAESSGFPLAGCCRPDGACGIDFGTVGWGCVERTQITGYMVSDAPLEAVSCGSGGEDAGL